MTRFNPIGRREWLAAVGAASVGAARGSVAANGGRAGGNQAAAAYFQSAVDIGRAIAEGGVSSEAITRLMFERIRQNGEDLNAVVILNEEEAMERARRADAEIAAGRRIGPLHGVPVTIKDAFETAGLRTTSGAVELRDYVPERDAAAVERLKRAGAVILGKTNVSEWTSDWQSHNEVFGTTNNPWDLSRTPGGSTGGGAAALAAGMGYLSLGSDMGGSIRIPAHFCGVYGHKPSLGVVPLRGHVPPPVEGMLPPPPHITVAGPLARSPADLLCAMEILGGPDGDEAIAYQWKLPEARSRRLRDFRIGYVLDDPRCPVVPGVLEVMENAVRALESAGARIERGWPDGIDPGGQFDTYLQTLYSYFVREKSPEDMKPYRERAAIEGDTIDIKRARSYLMTLADYQDMRDRQAAARRAWQGYFKNHDVFLTPVSFIPAFPHDHRTPSEIRKHQTSMGERNYRDLMYWISFATLAGLPATVAPIGAAKSGLPVGIQILGPYLEDATPIRFAEALAGAAGGFAPPPRYA